MGSRYYCRNRRRERRAEIRIGGHRGNPHQRHKSQGEYWGCTFRQNRTAQSHNLYWRYSRQAPYRRLRYIGYWVALVGSLNGRHRKIRLRIDQRRIRRRQRSHCLNCIGTAGRRPGHIAPHRHSHHHLRSQDAGGMPSNLGRRIDQHHNHYRSGSQSRACTAGQYILPHPHNLDLGDIGHHRYKCG